MADGYLYFMQRVNMWCVRTQHTLLLVWTVVTGISFPGRRLVKWCCYGLFSLADI